MNNLQKYIAEHASVKPNSEIASRWHSRVVANSLHIAGRKGAESYLGQYGKGIKEPKLIQLARMAEVSEAGDFAKRIWEEAYFFATGVRESFNGTALNVSTSPAPAVTPKASYGFMPQLLVPLFRHTAFAYLDNDAYCLQEKHDGERMPSRVNNHQVEGGNKKGLCRHVPVNVEQTLATMPNAEMDGEIVVGKIYFVFDLLSYDGTDLRNAPYSERYALLEKIIPANSDCVKLVRSVIGTAAKRAFAAELEARSAEGFVLKRLDAPYKAGENHGSQWKFQFRATIAVIAGKRNGDKSSVQMLVKNADGSERDLGFCTIPTGQRIPSPAEIMEVQYLYVHPGVDGKLAQPVFMGVRSDADASDCLAAKLKLKAA